tara:strand:+ start:1848 stop:2477 length:630 start_codon:yes stop_codon:yes gene_type:complete
MDRSPNLGSRIDKILRENLSLRTREFVESLQSYYEKNQALTRKQSDAFQRVESAWSPAQKRQWEMWVKQYQEEYKQDAKIIAKYYSSVGYYSSMSYNILDDDTLTPNRKDFLKMYSNTYAQKVLVATKSKPLFDLNQMVQIRATVGKTWAERKMDKFKLRKCIVLANDLPVKNAVKGGKRYRVLPMGSSEPIEIDERFLMKPNKRGKNS